MVGPLGSPRVPDSVMEKKDPRDGLNPHEICGTHKTHRGSLSFFLVNPRVPAISRRYLFSSSGLN